MRCAYKINPAEGRIIETLGGMVKFAYLILISTSLILGCNTKKRPNTEERPAIENKVEKPIIDDVDEETKNWFARQNTVYENKFENSYGKHESVIIDKNTERVRFTLFRDVSNLEFLNYSSKIKDAAFCRFELSGPVINIREKKYTKFHTEHLVRTLNMRVEFIEKVDVGPGSDRELCAAFEKGLQSQLPMDTRQPLPFYYLFTTPTKVFTLEKTIDGVDPRMSFLKLTTSHNSPEIVDWDLEYEPNDKRVGGLDYFNVRPDRSNDKLSRIYDLQEQPSCKSVGSNSITRYLHPLFWFSSTVDPILPQPRDRVPVHVGHCYLVEEWDTNSHVFALFRVLTLEKNRRVVLEDVEVLDIFQK